MSRDKQISDMQNLLWCRVRFLDSDESVQIAEALYNAGYRKSTDLAEEIFAEIEETFKECLWFLENHPSDYPRMDRTKINVYKDNLQYIAEIKNKYIGEDTNVTTNTEN